MSGMVTFDGPPFADWFDAVRHVMNAAAQRATLERPCLRYPSRATGNEGSGLVQPDPLLHVLGTGVRGEPRRFEHQGAGSGTMLGSTLVGRDSDPLDDSQNFTTSSLAPL